MRGTSVPRRIDPTQPQRVQDMQHDTFKAGDVAAFARGGNSVEVEFTSASSKAVAHGLGRNIRGWFVTRQRNGAGVIYEASSDDNTISFTSSGAGRFDVWVY